MQQRYLKASIEPPPNITCFTPYRICPIGAHSDHQFGKITGLAIDKGIHIAWLCTQVPVYAMEMSGSRYDIGNLERYENI